MSERLSRRFTEHFEARPEAVRALAGDHPAITAGRTMFPSRVRNPKHNGIVLIEGKNQRKIGDKIRKGAWAGMPVYTLTIEERATCPRSCYHWRTCYGNGMPWPERHEGGADLEQALEVELAYLARRHTRGFAVRLHILGDFYSLEYVAKWARWLKVHPQLRVWGYTARPRDSDIGREIATLNVIYPSRWFVRFSVAHPTGKGGEATTIWREVERTQDGIVCPVATGKTDACATCGLCWAIPMQDKDIVFIGHGMKSRSGMRISNLSTLQMKTLAYLKERAGQLVGGSELVEAIFADSEKPPHAGVVVSNTINRLRAKGHLIDGRRGRDGGYMLRAA